MGKPLLVIFDLESGYGESLFSYLNQKKEFPYDLKLVTTIKSLLDDDIALLLADQTLEGTDWKANADMVLYLSEDKEDETHINRYQSMDKIVKRVQALYSSLDNNEQLACGEESGMACLIGIYSPVGGCGKTELAQKITAYMARNGETAYYLDFELISNGLAEKKVDFFFDLHEKTMFKTGDWREYFSSKDGYEQLNSSLYQTELWELHEEDIAYLVQGIRSRGENATYVFDIGFFNQAMINLLHNCDYWVMPYQDGEMASYKITNLEQLLRFQGEDILLNKMLRFQVGQDYDDLLKKLVL